MRQALANAFERDILNCLTETNDVLIEVYDRYDCIPAEKRCYIKTEENEVVHFELNNPTQASVNFVAIDNCILQSDDLSRCDFAIGNFQKLYFVEIKQVKTNQRSNAKEKAIQQLGSTISIFKKIIDLDNTELIAVICLNVKQVHPIRTATSTAKMVAFKDNYNAILMEGKSATF